MELWSLVVASSLVAGWSFGRYRAGRDPAGDSVDVWERLEDEIERARRFGRCFEFVRIVGALEVTRPTPRPSAPGCRRTDRVWSEGDDLYILLTETDERGVERWIRRVNERSAGEELVFQTACFPTDGLTAAALLRHLDGGASADERLRRARPWEAAS